MWRALAAETLGVFLIVTLASTSMAKLRRLRVTTWGIATEINAPVAVARLLVLFAVVAELGLATLITFHVATYVTGCLTAAMFGSFAIYRAVAVKRTGQGGCTCAGAAPTARDMNSTATAGFVSSNVVLALLSLAWAFTQIGSSALTDWELIGWTIPVAALLWGLRDLKPKGAWAS